MPTLPDEAAVAWLSKLVADRGLDWDKLTAGQQLSLTREIPCSIRCWRIGEPVTTTPGKPCPECGQMVPLPTAWDRVGDEDAF